jgi:hypothetical protein
MFIYDHLWHRRVTHLLERRGRSEGVAVIVKVQSHRLQVYPASRQQVTITQRKPGKLGMGVGVGVSSLSEHRPQKLFTGIL